MNFRSLTVAAAIAAATFAAAPAAALSSITFGKVTGTGVFTDTRTGATPSAVRQQAQRGWDNPLTLGIDESVNLMWCIEPDVIAVFNQPITFTVMSLADYVSSGAITETQGNLFAGYARAGVRGDLRSDFVSGLLYQAAGGAINFGHAPTADFFSAANAAAALLPSYLFDMRNVTVYLSPFDGNNSKFSQDYISATAAVPEPANWAMLIAGFGLVGAAARRRRVPVVA